MTRNLSPLARLVTQADCLPGTHLPRRIARPVRFAAVTLVTLALAAPPTWAASQVDPPVRLVALDPAPDADATTPTKPASPAGADGLNPVVADEPSEVKLAGVSPAQLDGLVDVSLTADLVSGFYTPVSASIEVVNSGDEIATSVLMEVSDIQLDGLPFTGGVDPFALNGGFISLYPGEITSWSIEVSNDLTVPGLYSADLTLTYQSEDAGPILSQTAQLTFALVDPSVLLPSLVAVTYHLNDGTTNTIGSPVTVALNDPIAAAPTGPTRAGFDLAGWATTSASIGGTLWTFGTGGTAVSLANGVRDNGDGTGALDLYARWTPKTGYTVQYDLNYFTMTAAPAAKTGLAWTATGLLPATTVSRTGWSLAGWFTSASSDGSQVTATTAFNTLASADTSETSVTLYAHWIDIGLPFAVVSYNGTVDWTLGSQLGYGLFFATPLSVQLQGGDGQSGVARVDYLTTTQSFASEAAALTWANDSARVWTGQAGAAVSLTLPAASRGQLYLFVRVTDNAGNTFVAFDSITLYTNSTQVGASGGFTLGSSSQAAVDVALNGNTIAQITNTTTGLDLPTSAYSVDPTGGTDGAGSITLNGSYLGGLSAGNYEFAVAYNPVGVAFAPPDPPDARNQPPDTTTFTIQVNKQIQPALGIAGLPASSTFTYGDWPAKIGTTGGAGIGPVAWTMTPLAGTDVFSLDFVASPTGRATLTPGHPGQVTLQATKAADAEWQPANTATATVTVVKATPPVSLAVTSSGVYGQALTLTTTVGRVGTGAIPTGYVELFIDSKPLGANPIGLNAAGAASHTISDTSDLEAGDHVIEARYTGNAYYKAYGPTNSPDTDSGAKDASTLTVGKSAQTITISPITAKTWGDADFTLALSTPGAGTGAVTWSANPSGILTIAGTTATISGTGTVTITAVKAADADYNQASATTTLTVAKANPVWAVAPTGSAVTYGQFLSASSLTGGTVNGTGSHAADTVTGTITWDTPATIPDASTALGAPTGYPVTFTPTGVAATRYNPLAGTASLTVSKATPTVDTPPTGTPILPAPQNSLTDSTITGGAATHLLGHRPITVPGTWTWNTPATTWPDTAIGRKTAPATFTPADTGRYLPQVAAINLDVFSPVTLITDPPTASAIQYGQLISTSTLDVSSAGAQSNNGSVTVPIDGTWAWTTPTTQAISTGTYLAQATFTPDYLAPEPYFADEGYVPATVDIAVPVTPATPTLQTVKPPDVVYGQALSTTQLQIFQVVGVFDETIPGTLTWTSPTTVPSDVIGETGLFTTTALFTPTPGGVGDNYTTATYSISLRVIPDVAELTHHALNVVTPLIGGLHEQNFTATAVQTVTEALGDAHLARVDLDSTQGAVDTALAGLKGAVTGLIHDHPVQANNRTGGIRALGQDLTIKLKGDILDVVGLSFGGTALALRPVIGNGYQIYATDPSGPIIGAITPGSAIVYLDPTFLDTLPNGTYTLTITFTDNHSTGTGAATTVINRPNLITGPTTPPTNPTDPGDPTTDPTNPTGPPTGADNPEGEPSGPETNPGNGPGSGDSSIGGPGTNPTGPRHGRLPITGTNAASTLSIAALLAAAGITLLTWGSARIRRANGRRDH